MPDITTYWDVCHGDNVFIKSRFLNPTPGKTFDKANAHADYVHDAQLIPQATGTLAVTAALNARQACTAALSMVTQALTRPQTLGDADRELLTRAIPAYFGASTTLFDQSVAPSPGRPRAGATASLTPALALAAATAAPPAPLAAQFGRSDLRVAFGKLAAITNYVCGPLYIIDSGALKRTTTDARVAWKRDGDTATVQAPTVMGYVGGKARAPTQKKPIHINFELFGSASNDHQLLALLHIVHEASHAACSTTDAAYYWDVASFYAQTKAQLLNNADSYAQFVTALFTRRVASQDAYVNMASGLAGPLIAAAEAAGFWKAPPAPPPPPPQGWRPARP